MKLRLALAGLLAAVFLCLAAFSSAVTSTQASTTINVNTFEDELNNDGDCSLREAIRAANLDSAVDACPAGSGADTVILPAGTYTLTIPGASESQAVTGDLDIRTSLTLSGADPSTTVIDANQTDRVFHIHGSYTVNMANITIQGGNPGPFSGGGIYNHDGTLTLTNCVVTSNTANVDGGGIYSEGGVVSVLNSTISANDGGRTQLSRGGGIHSSGDTVDIIESTISGNATEGAGGGIYTTGTLNIARSAVFGNSSGFGGGIFSNHSETVSIVNSTVSGNTVDHFGGGIYSWGNTTTLNNVTVADNFALYGGGGIYRNGGTFSLKNTIIAANSTSGHDIDCFGSIVSEGYNLIQDPSGCGISGDTTSNITGVDPNLGPLQDNGGATVTHALVPCSPALDAGNPGTPGSGGSTCAFTDQRGTSRPQGARCDIGAYEAAILYAKTNGIGSCTGSWANACSLQTALSAATYGDQIWVATGVYTPAIITDRTATFMLGSGIALYGGFSGTGSGCGDRDWQTNITVLSGDIDRNDVTDPNGVITTTANIVGTNSYHVVTSSAVTETAILDGFFITGGDADGSSPHDQGGGMYNHTNSSPTLRNIAFSGNSAYHGGGMYNDHSSPTLARAVFQGNSAVGTTQPGGGGMCNYHSAPGLANVTFRGNSAIGVTQPLGGGMYNSESSPALVNVAFSGNSAVGGSGRAGGGIANTNDSNPDLINVTLSGNSAEYGGGIYDASSSPTLANAVLWGNSAVTGTQIHNDNSTPAISHSLVQDSGGSGGTWETSLGTDGGGNLDADPQFVDADGPDDVFGTADDDLRLQGMSPAIDAGDNDAVPQDTLDLDVDRNRTERVPFDLDGRPRVRGGTVEMGAYEWPLGLTLNKTVVDDDGGTATIGDFQAYLDGEAVPWGVEQTVISGTYTVSETVLGGYEPFPWVGDCAPDGTVTITLDMDEGATCSIVNDDIAPTITLTKMVVNDHGGTSVISDFQAYLRHDYPYDITLVSWGVAQPVASGTYYVREYGPAGYAPSPWGGDCAPDGIITLGLDEDATCYVVNDDIPPTITLIKTVMNDDGGTATIGDFQAYIDGQPVPWGTPQSVIAGTHTITESAVAGYEASPWGTDCAPNGTITVGIDEDATCSILNDDIAPTITLTKTVTNDDGGTATIADFQAYIDGEPVPWGVPQPAIAGTHTITESGPAGYQSSPWGTDCAPDGTISLDLEEEATCSILNDDTGPTIVLTKTVVTDHGGTATIGDFQAYVDGQPVPWGVPQPTITGEHVVSETQLLGYSAGPWGGDCGPDGTLNVGPNGQASCSITNDDIAATLTLTKMVIKDDGGAATIGDFQAYVDGQPVPWGVPQPTIAGTHTITESGPAGYQASPWGGDCTPDGTITLSIEEDAACYILNDDIGPTITLTKTLISDNGGTATIGDFQAYIDGQPVPWGVPQPFIAGSHTVSESVVVGYEASPWGTDCAPNGTISLDLGEDATCSIVNDDIAPTITLTKTVTNDDGGGAAIVDFQAYLDGQPVPWGVRQPTIAGEHVVSETQLLGYGAGSWGGDCGSNGTLTVGLNEQANCSITNDDIAATLTLTKTVVNDDGGAAIITDFQAYIDGQPVPWGVPQSVISGTHVVSETQVLGYGPGSWGGDCDQDGNVTVSIGYHLCTITNDDRPRYYVALVLKNY